MRSTKPVKRAVLFIVNPVGGSERGTAITADIRIDDRELSRSHATIVVSARFVTVEDQGSSNGTFVNDVEVRGRQVLNDHDRIAFGDFENLSAVLSSVPDDPSQAEWKTR